MKFCCEEMKDRVFVIDYTSKADVETKTNIIRYFPHFREFGIPSTGDCSYYLLNYCPWCGSKLPDSLREAWFETLEKRGYEDPLSEDVMNLPIEFLSDKWWNKN